MTRTCLFPVFTAAALLLLPGCTTFHREWRMWSEPTTKPVKYSFLIHPKTEPTPTPQSPYDGRWEGRWVSNKHRAPFSSEYESGRLQCVFTKIDPHRYRANFRAGWLLGNSEVLAELYGWERGKTLKLKGEFPLKTIFGGQYKYEGTVTPTHFVLNYDASYDTGTFELHKVK